jgi:iron(III) transport system ATP-binding protein
MLLDEPFSNVDANMRAGMRHEVETILRNSRTTTVFVSHDREAAFAIADRIAVMTEGRFDQIDTPSVLYQSPSTPFVARMSGVCDFLRGTVRGNRISTELGELPWVSNGEAHPDGSPVDLLVHADDFHVLAYGPGRSEVVSREFRGSEIILTVRTPGGAALRCRQDRYSTLPPGTRVTLAPAHSAPFVAFKASGAGK